MTLYADWLNAKAAEKAATDKRREIEDQLIDNLGIKETEEGTVTHKDGDYTIKAVTRLTRKVDADLLQELAAEHGLESHLSTLFRWKPEISMTVWKQAPENITGPLLGAITTTASRPSFTITINSKE